jgi:hypothetical protein
MVAAHLLPWFAEHGPATLQLQTQPAPVKAEEIKVSTQMCNELGDQRSKRGVTVKLPDAVEIPGPGTARLRIALSIATQGKEDLELLSQLKRLGSQLHLPQGHREQRLDLQRWPTWLWGDHGLLRHCMGESLGEPSQEIRWIG